MKKFITSIAVVLLFVSCSKDEPIIKEKTINDEKRVEALVKNKSYFNEDLRNGTSCAGTMSIDFTKTNENKLIFAISSTKCNPVGIVLNYAVRDDIILVYKKGTTDKLFVTLSNINSNTFVFTKTDNKKYIFKVRKK